MFNLFKRKPKKAQNSASKPFKAKSLNNKVLIKPLHHWKNDHEEQWWFKKKEHAAFYKTNLPITGQTKLVFREKENLWVLIKKNK